jgi:hypothetical protein
MMSKQPLMKTSFRPESRISARSGTISSIVRILGEVMADWRIADAPARYKAGARAVATSCASA